MDQALAFLEAGLPVKSNRQRQARWAHHFVDPETQWPMYELFLQRDDLPGSEQRLLPAASGSE